MKKQSSGLRIPHRLLAVALVGILGHGVAAAATQEYRISGEYTGAGYAPGTFILTFGLDPTKAPDKIYGALTDNYYFRRWWIDSISISFSGSDVTYVPDAYDSYYTQFYSTGSGNYSALGMYDADSNFGEVYSTAAFSNIESFQIVGASFDADPNYRYIYPQSGGMLTLSSTQTFQAVPAPVPEPETYAMLLAGLGVLGGVARRHKRESLKR